MMTTHCLCGSGLTYESCCEPLHRGLTQAQSPEQLMRSRYVAYALGGHGQYLLRTWFPAVAKDLRAEDLDTKDTEWLGLQVHGSGSDNDQGFVKFTATYREGSTVKAMHETSQFSCVGGRWYYIGGEVVNNTVAVGRNDLCPCGSGKKYKKCCMT